MVEKIKLLTPSDSVYLPASTSCFYGSWHRDHIGPSHSRCNHLPCGDSLLSGHYRAALVERGRMCHRTDDNVAAVPQTQLSDEYAKLYGRWHF